MTQMIAANPGTNLTGPLAAVTAGSVHSSVAPLRIYLYPMLPVEEARDDEPDAASFVLDTCCTECGQDGRGAQATTCDSCEVAGCDCEVREDAHGQGMFCTDCERICGCTDCEA